LVLPEASDGDGYYYRNNPYDHYRDYLGGNDAACEAGEHCQNFQCSV